MHFYALVIAPADDDLETVVAEAMAPFDENGEAFDYDSAPLSWDWYEIGGRWSGVLDDVERGAYPETRWPGDEQDAEAFAKRLPDLPDRMQPYAVITHSSESVTRRERWDGETMVDTGADMRATLATILSARMAAGLKDRVVVVDYHC